MMKKTGLALATAAALMMSGGVDIASQKSAHEKAAISDEDRAQIKKLRDVRGVGSSGGWGGRGRKRASKYTGAKLRKIRAERGVGRPPTGKISAVGANVASMDEAHMEGRRYQYPGRPFVLRRKTRR